MTSFQKVAFSFLTAAVLFSAFVFVAQAKLIDAIETRFFAKSKIAENQQQLDSIAGSCDLYIQNILSSFETGENAYLNSPDVRSYVYLNPSEKVEANRRLLTNQILTEFPEIEGLRLLEKNGRNINFSTIESDILETNGLIRKYKNYPDLKNDSTYLEESVIFSDEVKPEHKILFDSSENRIIFSFPFYKNDDTYFGVLLCYLNVRAMFNSLYENQTLNPGTSLTLVSSDDYLTGGFVAGIPFDNVKAFKDSVVKKWNTGTLKSGQPERILAAEDGTIWVLLSSTGVKNIKFGGVLKNSVFELSQQSVVLIYICVFFTILLIAYLLFSLKRDYMTVVKAKIKKVQFGIINEYLRNKEEVEWQNVAKQFEYRKKEFCEEIKKSVGGDSQKYEKEVESYLDSSWEEIIAVLRSSVKKSENTNNGASIEEIRSVMEEVLKSANLNVNAVNIVRVADGHNSVKASDVSAPAAKQKSESAAPVLDEEADTVEEIEEVEEVEEAEEAEEIEEAEQVEEIEDAEEVEEIEDAEELEEIEEAEEAEEIEEAEEVEEIEDAEEAEEVEEIEDAEELEEIEEAEELEEIEEAEPVETLEELEEADEVEPDVPPVYIPPANLQVDNIYEECADSYYQINDNFATVETVFAEELCIGQEYTPEEKKFNNDCKFLVSVPDFFADENAGELIPLNDNPAFSMTQFASNVEVISDLENDTGSN